MASFLYFVREAAKGFRRHISTTMGSIITIFLSLLLIGFFVIGGSVVSNVVSSIEDEVDITAYIGDKAPEEDVKSFESWVNALDGVAKVSYTSKEQALEDFKASMASSPEIVDQLDGQNPLPASYSIELSDPRQVKEVAASIEGSEQFKKICDNPEAPGESLKYGQKTVERLFSLTGTVRTVGIVVIILLVLIAFIFINNTIRLAIMSRQREISIMRLVGASNNFIRGPFLMEGVMHALVGSALAILVLELIHRLAMPHISNALMWLPVETNDLTYLIVYCLLVVFGLIIGALGAMISMRRYLKI